MPAGHYPCVEWLSLERRQCPFHIGANLACHWCLCCECDDRQDRADLWEQITSLMEDCHLAFSASAAISSLAAAYTSIEFSTASSVMATSVAKEQLLSNLTAVV